MNQKTAKKLRKFTKIAVLRAPLATFELSYQDSPWNGRRELSPTCARAIYHMLKRKVKETKHLRPMPN